MGRKRWTRSEKLTVSGLVLAAVAVVASFFIPEVRRTLHLEKPETQQAKPSPPQAVPQITPQTQTTAPPAVDSSKQCAVVKSSPRDKKTIVNKSAIPGSVVTGPITQGAGSAMSINQQGGITAAQVNLGVPDRHLSPDQKVAIITALQGRTCKVTMMGYAVGASDARDLAFEIQEALKAAGCNVPEDIIPATRKRGTEHGIFVEYYDSANYSEGSQLNIPDDSPQGVLIRTFIKAQLPVSAVPTSQDSKDDLRVVVGAR